MKFNLKDLRTAALVALAVFFSHAVFAQSQPAGTITNLRGFVTAESLDGSVRTLNKGDEVISGDTLRTTRRSNARLQFADNSVVMLRERTTFQISKFSYDEASEEDSDAEFLIRRGALETISGFIGQLFPAKYRMNTPISTIGIRGTTYQVEVITPENGQPIEVRVSTLAGAIVYSSFDNSGTNTPLPDGIDASADISKLQVEVDDSTGQIESIVLEAGNSLSQTETSEITQAIGTLFSSTVQDVDDGDDDNDDDDDGDGDGDDAPAPGSAID